MARITQAIPVLCVAVSWAGDAARPGDWPRLAWLSADDSPASPDAVAGSESAGPVILDGPSPGAASPRAEGAVLEDESLIEQVVDPTATPLTLRFEDSWAATFHGRNESGHTLSFKPTIPYKAFGHDHLLRLSVGDP